MIEILVVWHGQTVADIEGRMEGTIICGMYMLRHKAKHWRFRVFVPISVIANIVTCYFVLKII